VVHRLWNKIANYIKTWYNKEQKYERGGNNVSTSTLLKRLNQMELSPKQREELGASKDWKKKIDKNFLAMVARIMNTYKDAFKELAKH